MSNLTRPFERAPLVDEATLRELRVRAVAPELYARHQFFSTAIQRTENQSLKMQQSLVMVLEEIENEIDELNSRFQA